MQSTVKKLMVLGLGLLMSLVAACGAENQVKTENKAAALTDYYEVHHEGRIYVFNDAGTYQSFRQVGETAFRLTRIGAGPRGETVVFGLTKKDKKKKSGIEHVDLYDGKTSVEGPFYAEMIQEGRIYVFNSWKDLQDVKKAGEAPYRYTMIGAGPGGETVVLVLNKHNKKKKPVDMIELFNKMNTKK